MGVCMCVCLWMCVCVCLCMCIYLHVYICEHVWIYVYAHINNHRVVSQQPSVLEAAAELSTGKHRPQNFLLSISRHST